jgi:hypothetical protein
MIADDSCDGYETGEYDDSEVLSLSMSINEYVYENGERLPTSVSGVPWEG